MNTTVTWRLCGTGWQHLTAAVLAALLKVIALERSYYIFPWVQLMAMGGRSWKSLSYKTSICSCVSCSHLAEYCCPTICFFCNLVSRRMIVNTGEAKFLPRPETNKLRLNSIGRRDTVLLFTLRGRVPSLVFLFFSVFSAFSRKQAALFLSLPLGTLHYFLSLSWSFLYFTFHFFVIHYSNIRKCSVQDAWLLILKGEVWRQTSLVCNGSKNKVVINM